MKKNQKWLPQKTTKAYIHRPLSARIVLIQPDFKLVSLALNGMKAHTSQEAVGVHYLFGGEECDCGNTKWKLREDGIPFYTLRNIDEESLCDISLSAFCSDDRYPAVYSELIIENNTDTVKTVKAGAMPRFSKLDRHLTGIHDTGYEPYRANCGTWLFLRNPEIKSVGFSAKSDDGRVILDIVGIKNAALKWISRYDQPDTAEAYDYFAIDCKLMPGEKAVIRTVLRSTPDTPVNEYDTEREKFISYWKAVQSRVKVIPDTDDRKIIEIYRSQISQSMQMMQKYDGEKNPDFVFARQGDVGRRIWVWEAVHYLTFLDKAGIYDNISDCYRTFAYNYQLTEGENKGQLFNPYVGWDNTTGIYLGGLAYHIMKSGDSALYEELKSSMDMALDYVQKRRMSPKKEGEVQGLYPSGVACDWGDIGQHWTFTDAPNCLSIGLLADCYKMMNAENAEYVKEIYEDYKKVILSVRDGFAKEHENEASFPMPHILGHSLEETWEHCWNVVGEPYHIPTGFLDPKSRLFEQMEKFYLEHNIMDTAHGLCGRLTTSYCSPGLYGNVYYTGFAEFDWLFAYIERGDKEKARRILDGMLNYNLSPEHIVSERYSSEYRFYAPWQPNGSGSGRIGHSLLKFYGERKIK